MHGRILLAFALLACDAKTEPTKAEPAKAAKAEPAKTEPATPEGGSILDITMSSGQQLRAVPTECVVSETGKSVVVADGGNFDLRFENKTGRMVWKHPAGDIDEPITIVTMEGNKVRVNGITAAGAGYDGEITCK